jgi:hypothetical protein
MKAQQIVVPAMRQLLHKIIIKVNVHSVIQSIVGEAQFLIIAVNPIVYHAIQEMHLQIIMQDNVPTVIIRAMDGCKRVLTTKGMKIVLRATHRMHH